MPNIAMNRDLWKSLIVSYFIVNWQSGRIFHLSYLAIRNYVASNDCPLPCTSMTITFGFPIYDHNYAPDKGRVVIYFKTNINVRKNIVFYDQVHMLAEIGGYIGLLLGLSLLDLAVLFRSLLERHLKVSN